MKKKVLLCISILLLLLVTIFIIFSNKKVTPFYLEEKYYETNSTIEIELDQLKDLIEEKESFGIFIYQPMCATSSNFSNVLSAFQNKYNITFYTISFSKLKEDKKFAFLEYYPSFFIYEKGKLVDYLEADKDEDTNKYINNEEFEKWFSSYVKLREVKNNENHTDSFYKKEDLLTDINLENVIHENNKVNIYFFWGDGCPHCAAEKEFFQTISNEYGKYYNMYTFEVWKNDYNKKLLYTFANAMNEEIKAVPYTIIGNKTFFGYSSSYEEDIKEAILSESKNNYDVYFDKLKKK